MDKDVKNPFRLEELRDKFARDRKLKKLKETYKVDFPEIEDLNTPDFWDNINNRENLTKEDNPMGYDRLVSAASLIKGSNLKILNVGFGTGDLESKFLKNNTIEWIGVDISNWSVENAKKKYPKAKFIKGDIRSIALKSKYFDYVVLMEVLEHIRPSQLFDVLGKIRRLLKPKGKLIVTVPLNEGLELMIKKGGNPNAHVRIYTPELIKAELEISGFKVIWEKELIAFSSLYFLKTIISKYFLTGIKKPNNIIVMAEKK